MMATLGCKDIRYDMQGEGFKESTSDAQIGDLIWDPKMGDGHILVRMSKPFQIGYEQPWTVPECDCGKLDILDHHTYILARMSKPRT
jgi:hypothetical protein